MGFTDYVLKYRIEGDNSNLKKTVADSEKSLDHLTRSVQTGAKSAASEISNVVSAFTGDRLSGAASQVTSFAGALGAIPGPAGLAIGAIAGIGTAAIGAATAIVDLAKKGSEVGRSFAAFQNVTGASAETVSAFAFAASLSGKELTDLQRPLISFAGLMEKAADGSKAASATISKLGVKDLHDLDSGLQAAFKSIYETQNATDKLNLAADAFGKKGAATMLNLIVKSKGDFQEFRKEAEKLGVTLSQDDIDAAKEFGHAWETVAYQAKIGVTKLGLAYSGELTDAIKGVSGWLADNKDQWVILGDAVRDVVRDITGSLEGNTKNWKGWGDYAANVIDQVANSFKIIITDFQIADEWSSHVINTEKYYSLLDKLAVLEQKDKNFDAGKTVARGYTGASAQVDELTTPFVSRVTATRDQSGDSETSGGGRVGRIKPPSQTDSEFRKFFTDLGFSVTRTFGDALNKGSLHPLGLAADVSVRGKSEDEIAKLIANALEKGYRLVDERKKIPGVYQTGPHLHFERNSGEKASVFQDAGMYGSNVPLGYLQKLDAARLGKGPGGSTAIASYQQGIQKTYDSWSKFVEDKIKTEAAADKQAAEDRVALRQAESQKTLEIIGEQVDKGELTELDAAKKTGQLKLDLLTQEQRELGTYMSSKEEIQKYNVLEIQIQTQRIANEREIGKIERENNAARIKSWNTYVEKLIEARDIQDRQILEQSKQAAAARVDRNTSYLGRSLVTQYDELGNATTSLKGAFEDLKQIGGAAVGDLAQGLGSIIANFIEMGTAGPNAMRKVLASVLASVSSQAAVQAIMELAYGFAALTPWGAAVYGPAALHFKAAALFGSVAVIAGLAGRAVAGNSFKDSGKGGGGATSSPSSAPTINQNPTPYSRASNDAYTSSRNNNAQVAAALDRNTAATQKLHAKIDSMRPGDVLTTATRDKRGHIAETFIKEIGANAAYVNALNRRTGMR